ncbi:ATP-binding cassette domain-containing protein (plasmid) [Pseudomonas silvicola]|nr:ATP-binding cassette domain-containing protein [Pseudomonas silvicola]
MNNLLQVKNLNIVFRSAHGEHRAVRDVSFHVGREKKVAIVGESGSGKSQTCRALLQLTPKIGRVTADQMHFGDIDLLNSSETDRQIRGNRISMILQDPRFSCNPLMRIGDQVAEAFRLHRRVSKSGSQSRANDAGIGAYSRRGESGTPLSPRISGGMGQRVMIAMMLIPEPDLIIADEPTSRSGRDGAPAGAEHPE